MPEEAIPEEAMPKKATPTSGGDAGGDHGGDVHGGDDHGPGRNPDANVEPEHRPGRNPDGPGDYPDDSLCESRPQYWLRLGYPQWDSLAHESAQAACVQAQTLGHV